MESSCKIVNVVKVSRSLLVPRIFNTVQTRHFSSTSTSHLPRQINDRITKLPDIKTISGDIDIDGIHRFDLDTLETAEWTKELLLSMQNDTHDKAPTNTFIQPNKDIPLCFESKHEFLYDFSKPASTRCPVKLHVRVSELGLTKQQNHTLLVLVGKAYDPYTGVITLSREDEEYPHENNQLLLMQTFDTLLEHVKVNRIYYVY